MKNMYTTRFDHLQNSSTGSVHKFLASGTKIFGNINKQ